MKNLWISVLIAASLAILPSLAMSGPKWKTQDEHLTGAPKFANSSVASTTHTYTGYYAYGFSIFSVGTNVLFSVAHTTWTNTDGGAHRSTSTVITSVDGIGVNYRFETITKDLQIITHAFDTSATYYLYLDLAMPKAR